MRLTGKADGRMRNEDNSASNNRHLNSPFFILPLKRTSLSRLRVNLDTCARIVAAAILAAVEGGILPPG